MKRSIARRAEGRGVSDGPGVITTRLWRTAGVARSSPEPPRSVSTGPRRLQLRLLADRGRGRRRKNRLLILPFPVELLGRFL